MAIPSIRLGGPRRSAAARRAAAAFERLGAVRLEGVFPRPLLERARREVLRRHESGELKRRGLLRDIGGRYAATLPLEGVFLDPRLWAPPPALELLGALLGPGFALSSVETVISVPGASPQHQHVDGPLRFDRLVGDRRVPYRGDLSGLPPYAVTLCAPLCGVDEENGPTAIWPGSHKTALLPRPPGEAEIARRFRAEDMAGPLGSAFLFDFRVFHGGRPNFSREPRPLLILVYVRPWYRDPNHAEVRPGLTLSPRAYARAPERLKPLLALAPAARRGLWDEAPRRR